MSDRVLVSTHDLRRAGTLRSAFESAGYGVELVTPDEDLVGRDDAALLVLTEVEPDGPRGLARQAGRDLDIPVMGFAPTGARGTASSLGDGAIQEVFAAGTPSDEVVLVARRLLERHRLRSVTGIVGETDVMREVLERVVQIAPVASTVLLTGESGTGKELAARGLHALSPRRHRPFIAVNVAALSDTLLESELFGHEKGAFTGAIDSRRGLFELADKGTIFLDEIGEMPLATQVKLLRVLEQREFLRVGGEKPIHVDVRIVAATNQDLRQLVAIGEFRKDLYYRLNVLHIEMPALRDRRDDIPLLVDRFIREIAEKNDRPFAGISADAMEILKNHRWPGNVRELRNLVESMVVLAPGRKIRADDIPDEVRRGRRDLLPVPVARAGEGGREGDESLRPQLEFIFRTMVELRVDVDDLRKEFEAYRDEMEQVGRGRGEVAVLPGPRPAPLRLSGDDLGAVEVMDVGQPAEDAHGGADEGVVVFRPGMTMEDMEREAIAAALHEVAGNRRKAAELLGIGERTLYRKIKKYDLES